MIVSPARSPAKAGVRFRRVAPIGAAAPDVDRGWVPAFAGEPDK